MHPFLRLEIGIAGGVDVLTECKMSDGRPVDAVPGNLAKYGAGREGDLAADVWQAPVRRHESKTCAVFAQHAKHPDVHAILEILLPQILRYGTILANGPKVEFFTGTGGELAFRREGGYSP